MVSGRCQVVSKRCRMVSGKCQMVSRRCQMASGKVSEQWYRLHRISPHRGEFATFAKTVAIRGDFMLKCGKWRILLD